MIWMSAIFLGLSVFKQKEDRRNVFVQCLSIYGGLLFAALISATCDYVKEAQILNLKDEINN